MKIKSTLTTLALINLNLSAQNENQLSVNDFWDEITNTWATMVDKYLPLVWKEIYDDRYFAYLLFGRFMDLDEGQHIDHR